MIVRHFQLDDPRRQYAQTYADIERTRRIVQANDDFNRWFPWLFTFACLLLGWFGRDVLFLIWEAM